MAPVHTAHVPTGGGAIGASMLGVIPSLLVGWTVAEGDQDSIVKAEKGSCTPQHVVCAGSEAFWCGRSTKSPFVPLPIKCE